MMADTGDPAYGDMHPRFGYPGSENDVPELREYVESLIYVGYFQSQGPTDKPIVSFEVKAQKRKYPPGHPVIHNLTL